MSIYRLTRKIGFDGREIDARCCSKVNSDQSEIISATGMAFVKSTTNKIRQHQRGETLREKI